MRIVCAYKSKKAIFIFKKGLTVNTYGAHYTRMTHALNECSTPKRPKKSVNLYLSSDVMTKARRLVKAQNRGSVSNLVKHLVIEADKEAKGAS